MVPERGAPDPLSPLAKEARCLMGFDGLPLVLAWELTLACNLRCKHCGSAAGFPRRNELNLAERLPCATSCLRSWSRKWISLAENR